MKWLFLVHQVRTPNSRERVRVWRLTKKVGALLYRNSVYVLPWSRERLEDFHWLCQEIRDSRGEASVFSAEPSDEEESRSIRALFIKAKDSEYAGVLQSLEKLFKTLLAGRERGLSSDSIRAMSKLLSESEKTAHHIRRTDFFGAPLQERTLAMIQRTKKELSSLHKVETPAAARHLDRRAFRGKTWATRKNIHIDRLTSAWLIRRFIDPRAKFIFAPERELPKNALPFDTFGVEFSHHGEDCTFETLLKIFRIRDRALSELSEIVHDIDMKDAKFGRPEAAGLDAVVRSLSDSMRDDHKTLEVGSIILDALYQRLKGSA